MKITKAIQKRIQAACNRACGGKRLVEVGERCWNGQGAADGFNFLIWGADNDLDSTYALEAFTRDVAADPHGYVALDCYCYTTGEDGELDCNVYVLLDPQGEILYSSQDNLGHTRAINAILQEAGHPGYAPC